MDDENGLKEMAVVPVTLMLELAMKIEHFAALYKALKELFKYMRANHHAALDGCIEAMECDEVTFFADIYALMQECEGHSVAEALALTNAQIDQRKALGWFSKN